MNTTTFGTDLHGSVAVITGAGGVLCSQFSQILAMAGAKVALLDLNYESISELADQLTTKGFTAKAYKADVLNRDSLEEIKKKINIDLGICNILINGAGGNNPRATTEKEYFTIEDFDLDVKTFFNLDSEDFNFVFNLNFLGTLIPTQVFAKDLVVQKNANIINISSMNAFTPLTKIPAYSGAKAAISNFTQWLATHFSKTGVRVNAIAPGFFATKQNQSLLFNEDGTPTDRTKKILANTPMGRFGDPKELNGAIMFLLNEKAASFITGIILPIDGGFSSYSGV